MVTVFETYNQFDKKFDKYSKFKSDRSACPLFAIVSAHNFLNNLEISKETHEKNLELAISKYNSNNFPKYIGFEDLIKYTSLDKNNIIATSPELISENIIGYDIMFNKNITHNYSVIILKNFNFLIIMVKYNNGNPIYYFRDSHEKTQYNFDNFNNLREFLNNNYQFEKLTVVEQVLIEEFSNIEFLIIDSPFELKI